MEFNTYTISVRGIFKNRFEIYQNDRLVYKAKSTSIFKNKFILLDEYDQEILRIKQKLGFFKLYYLILEDGYEIAKVEKATLENQLSCHGDFDCYTVKGNFMHTQYDIFQHGEQIGKVSRKLLRMKKSYGIAIQADVDQIEVLSLCLILAIINVVRQSG